MSKKIRILVVEPNQEPKQVKIENSLKELQNIVGGLIEIVKLEHNADIICNEEGKLLNLELNRKLGQDVIAGTFIITGQHYGKTISLSKKQIKKYKNIFKLSNDKKYIDYLKENGTMSSELIYYKFIDGKE